MRPLLLLHGALASGAQMASLATSFSDREVLCPDLPGHGGRHLEEDAYRFDRFAEDLFLQLDERGWEQVDVFGYSMGGYAALLAAHLRPARFHRIATLGTKFDWNPETAAHEVRMLDPAVMEEKIPAFTQRLAAIHAPVDWRHVVRATAHLMRELGRSAPLDAAALRSIGHEVLILVGDRDTTAGVEASRRAAMLLPSARFEVLRDTLHPFEKADPVLLAGKLAHFFA